MEKNLKKLNEVLNSFKTEKNKTQIIISSIDAIEKIIISLSYKSRVKEGSSKLAIKLNPTFAEKLKGPDYLDEEVNKVTKKGKITKNTSNKRGRAKRKDNVLASSSDKLTLKDKLND